MGVLKHFASSGIEHFELKWAVWLTATGLEPTTA